jgi:hypothetical protein
MAMGYKEILGYLASLFLLIVGVAFVVGYFNFNELRQFTDFFMSGLVMLIVGVHFFWLGLTRFGVIPRKYYLS